MTYAREAARKAVWANTKRDPGRGDLTLERIIEDAINEALAVAYAAFYDSARPATPPPAGHRGTPGEADDTTFCIYHGTSHCPHHASAPPGSAVAGAPRACGTPPPYGCPGCGAMCCNQLDSYGRPAAPSDSAAKGPVGAYRTEGARAPAPSEPPAGSTRGVPEAPPCPPGCNVHAACRATAETIRLGRWVMTGAVPPFPAGDPPAPAVARVPEGKPAGEP